jgi:AraC-like DNA-binding protein
MPSSDVQIFSDPDDYASSIRAAKAEVTITRRGPFTAKLTRIDLHRLWMQRFSDSLPRVMHSAFVAGRAIVTFGTDPRPSLLWSGAEMQPINIIRHPECENAFQKSSGSTGFGSMSLPVEETVSVGATIGGCDLTPPKDPLTLTPAPSAMTRLQRLHAAAARLAEDAPEIISHPEAARGLEQALIEALVSCLGEGEAREDRSVQRRHSLILRRFRRPVEENPDRALYIPELCASIGATGRTLRTCCQEQLGMNPKRYLMLRRMHLVRRALRESAPTATTVTDVATQYGFWEFGRFAGEYKSLFGESPSATLHRPWE